MTDYIHSLYIHELESGRLDFTSDPGYRKAINQFSPQYDTVYQAGDHRQCELLWSCCFDLVHYSSRAAFYHGMRLGMGLIGWGAAGLSGL